MEKLLRLLKDEKAASLIEYSLLACLIALVLILSAAAMADQLCHTWMKISKLLKHVLKHHKHFHF